MRSLILAAVSIAALSLVGPAAAADQPIVIKFRNLDRDAMELESDSLRIEKVVAAGKDATIKVRAQKPGRYEFFDEYNEKTARGALVVR